MLPFAIWFCLYRIQADLQAYLYVRDKVKRISPGLLLKGKSTLTTRQTEVYEKLKSEGKISGAP